MGIDSRGKVRGKCTTCDCDYYACPDKGDQCGYCGHYAPAHVILRKCNACNDCDQYTLNKDSDCQCTTCNCSAELHEVQWQTLNVKLCKKPNCNRLCLKEGNVTFDYCGRKHAAEHCAELGVTNPLADLPAVSNTVGDLVKSFNHLNEDLSSPRDSISSPRGGVGGGVGGGIASPRGSIASPRDSTAARRDSISSPRDSVASPRGSVASPRISALSAKFSLPLSPRKSIKDHSPTQSPVSSPRNVNISPVNSPRRRTSGFGVGNPNNAASPLSSPRNRNDDSSPLSSPRRTNSTCSTTSNSSPSTTPRGNSGAPSKSPRGSSASANPSPRSSNNNKNSPRGRAYTQGSAGALGPSGTTVGANSTSAPGAQTPVSPRGRPPASPRNRASTVSSGSHATPTGNHHATNSKGPRVPVPVLQFTSPLPSKISGTPTKGEPKVDKSPHYHLPHHPPPYPSPSSQAGATATKGGGGGDSQENPETRPRSATNAFCGFAGCNRPYTGPPLAPGQTHGFCSRAHANAHAVLQNFGMHGLILGINARESLRLINNHPLQYRESVKAGLNVVMQSNGKVKPGGLANSPSGLLASSAPAVIQQQQQSQQQLQQAGGSGGAPAVRESVKMPSSSQLAAFAAIKGSSSSQPVRDSVKMNPNPNPNPNLPNDHSSKSLQPQDSASKLATLANTPQQRDSVKMMATKLNQVQDAKMPVRDSIKLGTTAPSRESVKFHHGGPRESVRMGFFPSRSTIKM